MVVVIGLAVLAIALTLYHGIVGATKFPYLWLPLLLLGLAVLALAYGKLP